MTCVWCGRTDWPAVSVGESPIGDPVARRFGWRPVPRFEPLSECCDLHGLPTCETCRAVSGFERHRPPRDDLTR